MIVLYTGHRGKGKTLTLVKDALKFKLSGWRVLSNFKTSFSELITSEEIRKINKESNIRNVVLLIDEIQIFFDSRRSSQKQNLEFSNFIQQIRKRGIILLCSTQHTRTLDLRILIHVDIQAIPKFKKVAKNEYICEVDYIDVLSHEEQEEQTQRRTIVYDPKPIFGLYDTNNEVY